MWNLALEVIVMSITSLDSKTQSHCCKDINFRQIAWATIISQRCHQLNDSSGHYLLARTQALQEKKRAWYILHDDVHVQLDTRKNWVNWIVSIVYSLFIIDRAAHHAKPPMVTQTVVMETPAHVRAMCTRPFLLLLKGLGTKLASTEKRLAELLQPHPTFSTHTWHIHVL